MSAGDLRRITAGKNDTKLANQTFHWMLEINDFKYRSKFIFYQSTVLVNKVQFVSIASVVI